MYLKESTCCVKLMDIIYSRCYVSPISRFTFRNRAENEILDYK